MEQQEQKQSPKLANQSDEQRLEYGTVAKTVQLMLTDLLGTLAREGADPGAVMVGACLFIGKSISRFPVFGETNMKLFDLWARYSCIKELEITFETIDRDIAAGMAPPDANMDAYREAKDKVEQLKQVCDSIITDFNKMLADAGEPERCIGPGTLPGITLKDVVASDPRFRLVMESDAMAAKLELMSNSMQQDPDEAGHTTH